MSILTFLFSWTKLPSWGLELILVGVLTGGATYVHHRIYESGVKAEVAKVQKVAAAQTAAAEAKATTAEHAHDTEIANLNAYVAAHPEQPVRLCYDPAAELPPRSTVARAASPSAAAGNVQPVHGGDSGVRPTAGPDIGGLLNILANRADQISAALREFQARTP
jgi:hypothetical protein